MKENKMNYDMPQNTKDTVIRLCRLMKPQRVRLSIIGLSIVIYTALAIYTPFKSAEVIDAIWQSIQAAQKQGIPFAVTWDGVGQSILSLSILYVLSTT